MNTAKNWLCISLVCLIGFAPLGRALAEMPGQQSPALDPTMMGTLSHHGHHAQQEIATKQCEHCSPDHTCESHDGSCNHCVSCITPLLPTLLDIHFGTLSQDIPATSHGLTAHLPSLLFRPPRG